MEVRDYMPVPPVVVVVVSPVLRGQRTLVSKTQEEDAYDAYPLQ